MMSCNLTVLRVDFATSNIAAAYPGVATCSEMLTGAAHVSAYAFCSKYMSDRCSDMVRKFFRKNSLSSSTHDAQSVRPQPLLIGRWRQCIDGGAGVGSRRGRRSAIGASSSAMICTVLPLGVSPVCGRAGMARAREGRTRTPALAHSRADGRAEKPLHRA